MRTAGIPKNLQVYTVIFVMVFVAYGYFSFGRDWNANSRLALVRAFVDEGVFQIDSYHAGDFATNDKAYFNGHYYSDKAIGTSVLGVIVYYPVHWFNSMNGRSVSARSLFALVTLCGIALPAALLAPFLYLLTKYITNNPLKALMITLGISLGTPLFKYSTAYYGHALAAASCFCGVLIWFYARRRGSISLSMAFVSAILLGYMIITEYPTVILLSVLLPYILYTLYKLGEVSNWKIYVIMAIGALIPMSLLLYYNYSIFGSLFVTGYSYESSDVFRVAHEKGVMGLSLPDPYHLWYLSFQPVFGIFWQSPILFLGLPGWFYMFRSGEYRVEAVVSSVGIFMYVVALSGFYMWWGGLSFAPRHLIPILPLFALPLAFVPDRLFTPLTLCTLVSVFQNLILTASNFEGLADYVNQHLLPAWNARRIFEPGGMLVYDLSLPNVWKGYLATNAGMGLGLKGPVTLLPLLFLELGLLLIYLRLILCEATEGELDRH
jgi:hypothetical protein